MKLSIFLSAVAVPAVLADFSVFFLHQTGFPGGEVHRWSVYDGTPWDWNDWITKKTYDSRDDVSGRKIGVRCKGSGCKANQVRNIDELEMHFANNPLYHWTIYKDRGLGMYGLDGRKYGDCEITTGNNFDYRGADGERRVRGYRKYRCRSQFTAAQIRGGS